MRYTLVLHLDRRQDETQKGEATNEKTSQHLIKSYSSGAWTSMTAVPEHLHVVNGSVQDKAVSGCKDLGSKLG